MSLAVDCGGRDCLACLGASCVENSDCASNYCKGNKGKGKGSQCTLR